MEYNIEPINTKIFIFLAEAYESELNKKRTLKLLHLLEQIGTDVQEIQFVLNQLKESLVQISANMEKSLLPLGIEYTNIFRGTGQKSVFLYEAVHRSQEGLMYEAPFFEVKSCYEKFGFETEPDWVEPEDHISVECQYLAFLSEKMAQGHDDGDLKKETFWQEQKNHFAREHFLQWVPQVSMQVIQNTSSDFYKELGILTEAVCKQLSSDIN